MHWTPAAAAVAVAPGQLVLLGMMIGWTCWGAPAALRQVPPGSLRLLQLAVQEALLPASRCLPGQ